MGRTENLYSGKLNLEENKTEPSATVGSITFSQPEMNHIVFDELETTKSLLHNSSSTKDLPGHPMFYELLDRMREIHAAKNQDYGAGDPLGNFKASADGLGISPFKGVLVRMSDKWSRIQSIVKRGTHMVKDETIEDTLLDLAVYSILAIVIKRETEK